MTEDSHLPNSFNDQLSKLSNQARRAASRLDGLNEDLAELHRLGLLGTVALLGPIVLSRPYDVGGPASSGQVVQVALTLPGGFGAIYWDSEERAELDDDLDQIEVAAMHKVVSFEECEPAVQALIAPHVDDLLARLLARARRS